MRIAFIFVEGRYPAACREFVIPAEAGIQRARLDSPVSSTGQAPYQVRGRPRIKYGAGPVSSTGQARQARNDGPEQKTIPRGLPRGGFIEIETLEGIKVLQWVPSSAVNCLIGPGDSTKTTVLDAVELCLNPRSYISPAPGRPGRASCRYFGSQLAKTLRIVLRVWPSPARSDEYSSCTPEQPS
ncbi:hypothetical protein CLG94_00610 [Candidatus Methylomirabilis limnetica]|uniref:Rad50/SbcC-type AAA domain-containing protein n=1 Tax=Candidatus Methylomirabilis limnetica TaxID=2033718 RepID=A0A2T4U130_9BACT|nr:hypothetical protein CLG94_00610 [Candidatus Methylomirabilis limnetica]